MGKERSRSSNQIRNGKFKLKKEKLKKEIKKIEKIKKTENRIVEIRRGSLENSFKPPKCELCR